MITFHKVAVFAGCLIIFNEMASTIAAWPSITDYFNSWCASRAEFGVCNYVQNSESSVYTFLPMAIGLLLLFIGGLGLVNSQAGRQTTERSQTGRGR